MYTLGKPHLFYFNTNKQEFNIDTKRNGQSTQRKWATLKSFTDNHSITMINVSFGICTHPFNPQGVCFKRKSFSKLKENEYGIAIKGTPISYEKWENLYTDENPIPLSVRRMMNTRGAEISYPYLIAHLKTKGLYELAKKSLHDNGINAITSTRTLPKIITTVGTPVWFVPMPIYAMEMQPYSTNLKILFNKKQTVRSWTQHHNNHDLNWEENLRIDQLLYESSGRA